MIQTLSVKYRKSVAWTLWFILYAQLLLPATAQAFGNREIPFIYHYPADRNSGAARPPLFSESAGRHENNISDRYTPKNAVADRQKKYEIGGPGQPEMQSFQSVNTSNMVDLFSGDFSYNVPLLDVGGYPVNIHYSSGISMDQESSWVGLGWNINPGTINRNMRGIPDDFNGVDSIARTQHIKTNKTVGLKVGFDVETVGLPLTLGLGLNAGIFHNNYNGWGLENGFNASISSGSGGQGALTAGLSVDNNTQTGISISPNLSVRIGAEDQALKGNISVGTTYNTRTGISALQLNTEVRTNLQVSKNLRINSGITTEGAISFAKPSYTPTISMPYTSSQYTFTAKVGGEIFYVHPDVFISGNVSKQEIKPADTRQSLPAVGYLYYSRANNMPYALLDCNRDKETEFVYNSTPLVAIPQYTYDTYSISGEGIGGIFRPYRGDVGYMRDHAMKTKTGSLNGSLDIGLGELLHVGIDIAKTDAITQNASWESANSINPYIKFQNSDSNFQEVYFRNPGEKTSNALSYYQSIGDDALMRVKLGGSRSSSTALNTFTIVKNNLPLSDLPVNAKIVKPQRDKRGQVITYLTGSEALLYGLDKAIKSYKENTVPLGNCTDTFTLIHRVGDIRQKHHISEIDVLNTDGKRYVYGLPAYNVLQKDVTFAVTPESDASNISKGLVNYQPIQFDAFGNLVYTGDNSINNNKGKDNYYTQDSIPAFAHSFLLTGILSPDYIDVTGDGITSDDIGDAVKFNYTRVFGPENNYYGWRTPFEANKATYNEGLKSYSRDDKGTYMYGRKEVWYMNSIESKTMIAVFKTKSDRRDGLAVSDENGTPDPNSVLRRLDEIDLYTKADLIKSGAAARPVKSVHFVYSYKLCSGINGLSSGSAKLTLDSIWFSYNGNIKGKQNPYVFSYHPDGKGNLQAVYNPAYNPKSYDKWGNFKDPSSNPAGMNNVDYPYSVQDSTLAAQNAQAWHLSDIQLPSGGHMNITYESDDYAYVQNKRASQFYTIAGISNSPTGTPDKYLYNGPGDDNYYVFINTVSALIDKNDIKRKFLANNDTVFFKLAVKVPDDKWGGGYEWVPVYGRAADYGVVTGNSNQFWIRLDATGGESPLARAAVQFLRLNLPSKAYPGSETGDDFDFSDAVKMLVSSYREIQNTVSGFDNASRIRGVCREIDNTRSFIRLTNPDYKKYGGGIRVKRVQLFDHWTLMTGQKESTYGQEYTYTKTILVNGQQQLISSGVAAYEPMIGGDENPFREPIAYAEKIAPLGPVNYLYAENPIGESFFPSASVGYSKVRVRTINTVAKSANGWEETQFFTTQDFPTLFEHTVLDDRSKNRYNPKLAGLLKINAKNYVTLSQGYKVETNDMNGKIKSQATYPENDPGNPIKAVYNFYRTDNPSANLQHLNNSVWTVDSLNGHLNPNGSIGKDIEVMVDMREQTSTTRCNGLSPNVDLALIGWFPLSIGTLFKLPQFEQTRFRSAATVKVIQRYGILDSVVAIDKGSVVSTKNLVFDAETGNPVLARSNNEFNDPVYNFNYPAYWAASGMSQAYKNINDQFSSLYSIYGKLFNKDGTDFPASRYLESGDEIWVNPISLSVFIPFGTPCVQFIPNPGPPKKVWAINAAKGLQNNQGIYLIDENGKPYTANIISMKIIRSGKRNMTDISAGSIVSLANLIRQMKDGSYRIVIDSNSQVLNAGAATYKDFWKVSNALYAKDTTVQVYHDMPPLILPAVLTNFKRFGPGTGKPSDTYTIGSDYLASSYEYLPYRNAFGCNSLSLFTKTAMNFNLSLLPAGAIITNASLTLSPKIPLGYWNVFNHCTGSSYDWSTATTYYQSPSSVNLSRITAAWSTTSWNPHKSYTSFQTTATNAVVLDYNSVSNGVNCTSLVQDMLSNPNYGLMFEMAAQTHNGNNHTFDYLSFCAAYESNINCGKVLLLSQPLRAVSASQATPKVPQVSVPGIPCDCSQPTLTVSYRQLVDSTFTVCRPYIVDSATNPYRWGILGNWRMDRAYTYYNARKESDASITSTNIRVEGQIPNFVPFWKFTDSVLIPSTDSSRWVWNSAMSLYNRKGFEIENYDPLGRYNSGLYGYTETLPVAVTQNSKYRNALFDGFEDYSYTAQNCVICQPKREFDFVGNNSGVAVSNTDSHSGLYSLHINGGSQANLVVPVTTLAADTAQSSLFIKVDSTPVYSYTVVPRGTGLTGNYRSNGSGCGLPAFQQTRLDPVIKFGWKPKTAPIPGMCYQRYTITWKGEIQAQFTDFYRFYGKSAGLMQMTLTSGGVTQTVDLTGNNFIYMAAGTLYTINVQYSYNSPGGKASTVQLSWSRNGNTQIVTVPQNALYPQNIKKSDTAGSVITTIVKYCIALNNVKPTQVIRPAFSPLQGTAIVMSIWLKIDGPNCNSAPALDNVANISFDQGGTAASVSLARTGVRIEGWQRYESVVNVPANATLMTVSLQGNSATSVFVDDVRMNPFNSLMKGFVYNPFNLRLMAELDENNYATFYEYDDDGTLIRLKKETERGIQTIKETRSGLVKDLFQLK